MSTHHISSWLVLRSPIRKGMTEFCSLTSTSTRAYPRCVHPSHVHKHVRRFTSLPRVRQQIEKPLTAQDPAIPQTYYDLFPETFEDGPPPKSPFTPDLRKLRREFLQLQAKAHPDVARPEQKRQAEGLSARINEAYKTLQDPLRRARYLLSLENIDMEDDSSKLSENALLLEVMEAREAVEEAEDEAAVAALKEQNRERVDESVRALEQAFAAGDLDDAAHHAVRLRYWNNIEESIQGWEQGRGGGVLHH